MSDIPRSLPIDLKALRAFCATVTFTRGDVLREEGRHYRDMYVLTEGQTKIEFAGGSDVQRATTVLAGWPIGEIGFLLGTPAAATVTATGPVSALVIDDATLARLEQEQPALAARFLRTMAEIADRRVISNTRFGDTPGDYAHASRIDIRLARGREMIEAAQRLRYEVYCGELGRTSPDADDARRIIADGLDGTGNTFVALEAGEAIGTLRLNFARDAPLGVLEDLYGMERSPHHPAATAICTRFIVRRARQRGPAAMKLIATVARHCGQNGIKEVYADCVSPHLPFYKAIGFRVIAPSFFHRENGPSHPMMIDVESLRDRWDKDIGLLQRVQLYVKAKAIKWVDGLRGALNGPTDRTHRTPLLRSWRRPGDSCRSH
jgi:N-acyl-L-homoserine lactone synthetase